MKRAIALVVIVAYLMQLTGCAVYRVYRLRPDELTRDELAGTATEQSIKGFTTKEDEKVRVSGFGWATVQGDTLLVYAKDERHHIALSDIRELWVKRKDPELSGLATLAFCATIIIVVVIATEKNGWIRIGDIGGGLRPRDFGGGVG